MDISQIAVSRGAASHDKSDVANDWSFCKYQELTVVKEPNRSYVLVSVPVHVWFGRHVLGLRRILMTNHSHYVGRRNDAKILLPRY